MASWHINTVRVPLNEDCWLGINGTPDAFSGSNYRDAIVAYVGRLHAAGLYAIVDLHWSAQGTLPADGRTGQGRQMADRDHAPAFWRSVATTFRTDPAVVFHLFNEPHDITWPDCGNPVLITAYDGTPTAYGIGVRDHLAALWQANARTRVLTPVGAYAPLAGAGAAALLLIVAFLGTSVFTLRRLRSRKRAQGVTAM